jgi:translation initiation factor 1 (eIF-1/SUI1)
LSAKCASASSSNEIRGLEASRTALEERLQQMSLDLATSATAAALEAIIERIQGDVAELVTERRKKMQGPQAHGS